MTETHAPRSTRPFRLAAYGTILALFFGLHYQHIVQVIQGPPGQIPIIDSKYYIEWAVRVLQGLGLGPHAFFMSPLYPLLIALAAHLKLGLIPSTFALQTLLSAGTLLLIGRYASRRFGTWAGPGAALLYTLYAPALYYDAVLLSASLILFLTMAALTLLDDDAAGLAWWRIAAAGLAIGLSVLARPNALLLLVAFGVVFVLQARKRGLAKWGILVAAAALVLLPVMVRNASNGGPFSLTTNSLGVNLYIGNHADAAGIYTEAPFLTSAEPIYEAEDYRREAERRTGEEMTVTSASRFWTGEALSWMVHHPFAWLKLEAKKFAFFFNRIEIANNVSLYGVAQFSKPLAALRIVSFGLVAPLGLIGFLFFARRRSAQLPLALVASYLLANLLFFVSSEYRFPIVGVLIVYSIGAVAGMVQRIRARDYVPAVQATTALLLLLLFVNAPWSLLKREADPAMDFFNWASVSYGNNDLMNASLLFSGALARRPDWSEAHLQLALVFEDMGLKEQAEREFKAAGVSDDDIQRFRMQDRLRKDVVPEELRGDPSKMSPAQLTALAARFNQLGRSRDALPLLKRAVMQDSTRIDTWFQYGIALENINYLKPAIQAYYKAYYLDGNDPLIPYRIAWCNFQLGDAGTARSNLRLAKKKVDAMPDNETREKWLKELERTRQAFMNY